MLLLCELLDRSADSLALICMSIDTSHGKRNIEKVACNYDLEGARPFKSPDTFSG